jgi:hypothetical protein
MFVVCCNYFHNDHFIVCAFLCGRAGVSQADWNNPFHHSHYPEVEYRLTLVGADGSHQGLECNAPAGVKFSFTINSARATPKDVIERVQFFKDKFQQFPQPVTYTAELSLAAWPYEPYHTVRCFTAVLWEWQRAGKMLGCKTFTENSLSPSDQPGHQTSSAAKKKDKGPNSAAANSAAAASSPVGISEAGKSDSVEFLPIFAVRVCTLNLNVVLVLIPSR